MGRNEVHDVSYETKEEGTATKYCVRTGTGTDRYVSMYKYCPGRLETGGDRVFQDSGHTLDSSSHVFRPENPSKLPFPLLQVARQPRAWEF